MKRGRVSRWRIGKGEGGGYRGIEGRGGGMVGE